MLDWSTGGGRERAVEHGYLFQSPSRLLKELGG